MPRNKVNLQYIPHDSTRLDTLKKRSRSLMKKAGDVATLCNIQSSIIVYGEGESMPQVFLSHDNTVSMLNRLKGMDEHNKFNKKIDQQCFLKKRIGKLRDQECKTRHELEERDIKSLLHKTMLVGHVGLSVEELTSVGSNVEVLHKSISDHITKICGQPPVYQPSQVPSPCVTSCIGTTGSPLIYQAQVPPQQQDEWLDLMRSGGGDLTDPVCNDFNIGTTTSTSSDFNIDEMMQSFDLGEDFGFPWGDGNPGPSLTSFPPM